MNLPDAIYAGMSKSGSTYIYQILKEHPDVFVPEIKDIYFFDRAYAKGLDWYAGFFAKAVPGQTRVELSHDYIFSAEATARLKKDLPGVKIIICLREPLDWIASRYAFEKERRPVGPLRLDDAPENAWLRAESDIAVNVERYLKSFAREDILILFYEDLKRDPAVFCQQIYAFLGVDAGFVPPSLNTVVLPAHKARIRWLAFLAQKVSDGLRALGLQRVVGFLKNLPLVEKVLYRPAAEKYRPDVAEEEMLRAFFAPRVTALRGMLDIPLPAAWRERFPS
ncbi:MAG: hypothetical protein GC185_02565 [Alphaproteobacteria bacterium]|nr:hypothetical protein [Alphaproteobacteria bacterium]